MDGTHFRFLNTDVILVYILTLVSNIIMFTPEDFNRHTITITIEEATIMKDSIRIVHLNEETLATLTDMI